MIAQLIKGVAYLDEGQRLTLQPDICLFVWIPLILNIGLYSVATHYAMLWI